MKCCEPPETVAPASQNALKEQLRGIPGLSMCFDHAAQGKSSRCLSHKNCPVAEFCSSGRECKPREECRENGDAVDGSCPIPPSLWQWTTDNSVQLLTETEARMILGRDASRETVQRETTGIGFELVSAPPPQALAGQRGLESTVEVLTLLRSMGVQAGPTQGLHVHINVGKPGQGRTPGKDVGASLTMAEISNVWAHYARYQHVIDELLQDNRINNEYSVGLHFHEQIIGTGLQATGGYGLQVTAGHRYGSELYAPAFFNRMHRWVHDLGDERTSAEYCNWVNAGYLSDGYGVEYREEEFRRPCSLGHPKERYQHINLCVLNKFGTMEFRAFPATNDPERAMMWVRLLLNFVETFKSRHEYIRDASKDPVVAMRALEAAQATATLQGLANDVGMGAADLRFWKGRSWIDDSPACRLPGDRGDGSAAFVELEPREPTPTEDKQEPQWWNGHAWMPKPSEWSHAPTEVDVSATADFRPNAPQRIQTVRRQS